MKKDKGDRGPESCTSNMYQKITLFRTLALLATTSVFNIVSCQTFGASFSNTSKVDALDVLRNLDIQNVIQNLVKDGTLESLVQTLISEDGSTFDISEKCLEDTLITIEGLLSAEMWALQMIDAFGKPHSGILSDMDLRWIGSYDSCLKVKAITYSNNTLLLDPVHHFDGKYCRITLPLPKNIVMLTNVDPRLTTGIDLGICIPDDCNGQDVKNMMSIVGKYIFNASSTYVPAAACNEGRQIEPKTIVAICILSILVLIATIGTIYDIYLKLKKEEVDTKPRADQNGYKNVTLNGAAKSDKETESQNEEHTKQGETVNGIGKAEIQISVVDGHLISEGLSAEKNIANEKLPCEKKSRQLSKLERIFLSFSVYSNGLKLLSTNQPKGALTCINGVRFLSTTWVILGHSTLTEGKNGFAYYFGTKVWQWTFYGIFSATVSVDTFFTMSGLLVGYLTLREMKKAGGARKMNWFMFYFHRYWRLTPAYMLSLMFWTTIFGHLVDGPNWPMIDIQVKNCEKSWWTNLLYINNYVNNEEQCFGWGWYLANDMQFYIFSPLIIIPLFYNAAIGGVIAGLFLTATTVARAVISKQHEYTAITGGFIGPKPKDGDFGTNLYIVAYTRMGPYLVGLVTGFLLYRYNNSFKLSKKWNLLGWFTCLSIITLVIYGVYPDDRKHFLSVDESVTYVTLHRTGWGVAVCWIIFACATGHGGWINDFLSWSAFIPLARLSYCTYLVHVFCLEYYIQILRQGLYVTDIVTIYFYLGNVVMSYMAAFVTSLLFESPMMGLEKLIFGRKR